MYRIVSLTITLFLLSGTAEAQEFQCPPASASSALSRLRTDILCDYDYLVRPVKNHHSATNVSFILLLKYFSYDHYDQMLSMDAWFIVLWTDEHIKWKPADYDGITDVQVYASYDIWVPDLSVYNRKDLSTDSQVISTLFSCTVSYQGTVHCGPSVHFDTLCVPDLQRYPYDMQECTVRFGSWIYLGHEVNLYHLATSVVGMEPNGEWELVSAEGIPQHGKNSQNFTYSSIDVVFEIRRHSGGHTINEVLPLIVCILLTLTTMTMSPLKIDRLILCFVNLLTHVLHLQNLSYTIPKSGKNIPHLLRISRDSALLSGLSILATVYLKYLMQNTTTSPVWVSRAVSVLIRSRPGQLFLLPDNSLKGVAEAKNEEDGVTIISSSESLSNSVARDWYIVGKFLDVLLLIVYILCYFILFVSI